MSEKAKPTDSGRLTRAQKAGRKIDDVPGTITHRKVAEKIGVTPELLRDWVAKGEFPEPLAVIGYLWLYREDIIRSFLEKGVWPEGTKFKRRREGEETIER